MQSHRIEQVVFRRRAVETARRRSLELLAACFKTMDDVEADLLAVAVANHIVMEYDASHSRELHAARLHETSSGVFERLGTLRDESLDRFAISVLEATAREMPVRAQYRWPSSRSSCRTIEISRDVESRDALEIDLLDRIALLLNLAVNPRSER